MPHESLILAACGVVIFAGLLVAAKFAPTGKRPRPSGGSLILQLFLITAVALILIQIVMDAR